MSVAGVNVAVSEAVTKVTASSGTKIAVALSEQATNIKINNFAIPVASTAAAIAFTPYGALTATNIADAIQQLADQNFRSPDVPTGSNVGEGDIWYDTDDDELKVVPMDRIRDGIRFDQGIAIVDGKSVYFCTYTRGCVPIADDYTKELKIPN